MGNSDSSFSEDECSMCRRETQQKACTNPYICFYLDVYKELAPKTVKEIGIEAGRRWRTMTEEQKEPYIKIARQKNRNVHLLRMRNRSTRLGNKSCRAVGMKKRKHLRKGIKKQLSDNKVSVKLQGLKH